MIQSAYGRWADGVSPNPKRLIIINAPDWYDTDLYDLEAKAEGPIPPGQLYGPMLQTLLEDRFGLKTHTETRERPAYALMAPKGASKIAPFKNEDCIVMDVNHLPPPPPPGKPYPKFCGRQTMNTQKGNFVLNAYGMTMREFCDGPLSAKLDRPVVDRTGVSGRFDLQLIFAPDAVSVVPQPSGSDAPAATETIAPSIYTAIQEQLGLKLESTKAPVDALVIDSVQKPTAN